jgi:excisionase family DNA binding protein
MDQEPATAPPGESSCLGPVYTTEEVGKMLKVPQRTVQEWVRSGALSCVQYGKHLRIRPTDLAAFGKVRNPCTAPSTDVRPRAEPAGAVQE